MTCMMLNAVYLTVTTNLPVRRDTRKIENTVTTEVIISLSEADSDCSAILPTTDECA